MDVFDLFAKLSLDTSEYDQGLKNAQSAGSSFGTGLANATRVGAAAIAAVGTAAVAAGTSLVNGASDVAQYGDNIDKMSQKIGISAEAYQEWDAVMQHCGASIDSLQPAMKTLANEAQTGNEAFEQLGISQEEVANLSQEDLFARVVSGLQEMEEGTERTYIASQLLGRGATELGALFNTSAEDTQAMIDRVHELGGVMSDEAVKSAANFQDELQDMQTAFAGVKRGLMGNFLPSITTVMSGLTEIFAGNYDEGLEQISAGIDAVVQNLTTMMPEVVRIGVGIIESLATAVIENLPTMLPALMDLVMGIGDMIIENLPLLVETALQIVLQLATGIAESLPTLIPTIVDVVITIVETLIDNVDLLIDASVALIVGLAEGLINALPRLIEKAPEIVMKLVDAIITNAPKLLEAAGRLIMTLAQGIVNNIPKVLEAAFNVVVSLHEKIVSLRDKLGEAALDIMNTFKDGILGFLDSAKTWGKDLIDNFVNGIKAKIDKVKETVGNVAQTVKDILGFSEPEEGPLSNFHTFAPDMMELFAQGIRDNEKMLQDTVADAFDLQDQIAEANVNATAVPALAGGGYVDENMVNVITEALRNIMVQVNIGDQPFDDMVSTSIQRTAYRTGGRG